MLYEIIIISTLSYLIGCIPNAYLLVKLLCRKDIRYEGTGNIGAMNSFDITGDKRIGISVFVLDALKGIVAVLIAELIGGGDLAIVASMIAVVAGHNFNVFLKFHGGRGLSTSVGVFLLVEPIVILFWLIVYYIIKKVVKNDVHISTVIASIVVAFSYFTMSKIHFPSAIPIERNILWYAVTMVNLLIILSHYKILKSKIVKSFK